jgi:hypothetical protein
MDKLTDSLNTHGQLYHQAILVAMKFARKKMNRYYSLTDDSAPYRMAMVLHPGLKLEYFRRHQWEDEWIEQAENMVREEFILSYEKTGVTPDDTATKASSPEVSR